jgi:hypothetical protein
MSKPPKGSFVLPTTIAVQRYAQMKVEGILNTDYQVTGEQTPLEHCLKHSKDPGETVALLNLPADQAEIAVDILEEALEGGAIDEIYGLRGGVLNILMPPATEDLDQVNSAALAAGTLTADKFMHGPHEMFSSLSPAQVWAGAGKHELGVAEFYLPKLWREMKDNDFPTTGAANTEWLGRLRLWSYNPAGGYNGRIIDVITYERNENFKKRVELASECGIDIEFELPEIT